MSTIEIQNLKFSYASGSGDSADVASSINSALVLDIEKFVLQKNESVFLYGPSGCGKSTLLEIIAGVLRAPGAQVKVENQSYSELSAAAMDQFRADHIGYIFQNFNLIPYLSVYENITLPLSFSAVKRAQVSVVGAAGAAVVSERAKVQELLQHLGLAALIDKSVLELSVGQQQRVAAARALIGSPKLILADEPTSALDFDHREKFIKLLFEICKKQNISILFVSHDRTLAPLFDRHVSLPEINRAKGLS